jgi:hypothetical protein
VLYLWSSSFNIAWSRSDWTLNNHTMVKRNKPTQTLSVTWEKPIMSTALFVRPLLDSPKQTQDDARSPARSVTYDPAILHRFENPWYCPFCATIKFLHSKSLVTNELYIILSRDICEIIRLLVLGEIYSNLMSHTYCLNIVLINLQAHSSVHEE